MSNKIKYSDLIGPDDSIERLIKELTELKALYSEVHDIIKRGAKDAKDAMVKLGGATNEGRESIKKATDDASRLERAHRELTFALSDTGAKVAELKMLTNDANKASRDQARYANTVATSYSEMKAELALTLADLRKLSKEQALNSKEGALHIERIIQLKQQMKEYDDALKLHVTTQAKLKDVNSENNKEAKARNTILAQLVAAEEKLAYARSNENKQLKLLSTQTREANETAKLQAIIANNVEGSYNRVAAQYALNKINLNKLSEEERKSSASAKQLEKDTYDLYQAMIRMQESTGKHTLSVGNYAKTWDGLGVSVSQIVRELPAAAVSLNTFFLAISNNVPMLVDEIQKLRVQNKLLAAEGKPTTNVIGSIVKSLMSWNTILVILLTVFSMYGKQIFEWAGSLIKGKKAVISLDDAIDEINKTLKEGTSQYGKHLVTLKSLQKEWSNLKTLKDREKFIRDNASAFKELDVQCTNVNEADNIFVKNTQAVVNAIANRAKAAAAQSIAEKKYAEAFAKQEELDQKRRKQIEDDRARQLVGPGVGVGAGLPYDPNQVQNLQDQISKSREDSLNKEAEDIAKMFRDADLYIGLQTGFEQAARDGLAAAGIGEASAKEPKQPRGRDLTDQIARQSTELRKKYAESITASIRDEYKKQIQAAYDAHDAEIEALQDKYDKNKRILENENNLYKTLTEDQINKVKESQNLISGLIENSKAKLSINLENIEAEHQQEELRIIERSIELRLEAVRKGSQKELELKQQLIDNQRRQAILANRSLPSWQRQSEASINASFGSQSAQEASAYATDQFRMQQELEASVFNEIKRSEFAKTKFKLEQEKQRQLQILGLVKKGAIDMSETEIAIIESTVRAIDRELKDVDKGGTLLEKLGFDDDQIGALQEATMIIVSQLHEIMQAEIDMAKMAVDAAKERVSAAQSAYDAEVEARANGYANQVSTRKKELDQEKRNQAQKQKMLEQAQRRQEAINTVTQASSLVTASANIWSSLSSIPVVGPGLAIAAIASMWSSFAAAKIKARQVTAKQQTEEYGDGGLEFLEGGSHASGNDIDLGIKNKRNKRMKVEGGEALAIVNKRNTRKYKHSLPGIIDSLNKGTFEEKYVNAFSDSEKISNTYVSQPNVDLTTLEDEVTRIRRQNETQIIPQSDGSVIVIRKNVKQIIRK